MALASRLLLSVWGLAVGQVLQHLPMALSQLSSGLTVTRLIATLRLKIKKFRCPVNRKAWPSPLNVN